PVRAVARVLLRGRNPDLPHRLPLLRHRRLALLRPGCRLDPERDSGGAAGAAGRRAAAAARDSRIVVRAAELAVVRRDLRAGVVCEPAPAHTPRWLIWGWFLTIPWT